MRVPATAGGAFPGSNCRIAFEMRGVIYSIQPTGAGLKTLTKGPDDHSPRWSPNGKMIVFERAGDLWMIWDGLGRGIVRIANPGSLGNGAATVATTLNNTATSGNAKIVFFPTPLGLPLY